jgi:hypothetical protein
MNTDKNWNGKCQPRSAERSHGGGVRPWVVDGIGIVVCGVLVVLALIFL